MFYFKNQQWSCNWNISCLGREIVSRWVGVVLRSMRHCTTRWECIQVTVFMPKTRYCSQVRSHAKKFEPLFMAAPNETIPSNCSNIWTILILACRQRGCVRSVTKIENYVLLEERTKMFLLNVDYWSMHSRVDHSILRMQIFSKLFINQPVRQLLSLKTQSDHHRIGAPNFNNVGLARNMVRTNASSIASWTSH